MSYTTTAKVKNELPFNYQKGAERKLQEDGYISAAGTFDEESFLSQFVDQMASFIDSYLAVIGTGPFGANALLDKINKQLATYEVETYIISATQDRQVSVSIYAMYKIAMETLDKIVAGKLVIEPAAGEAADSGTVRLIEPDNDGATLQIGDIEQDILLGGSASATEIPE